MVEHESNIIAQIENEFADHSNDFIMRITSLYQEPEYLLEINGTPCLPKGDISGIVARAKQGKSFLSSIFASAVLRGECLSIKSKICSQRVLFVDTEQASANTHRIMRRIYKLCNWSTDKDHPRFRCLNLRTCEPHQRLEIIKSQIEDFKPHLVIIDGIRDLLFDFNDLKESSHLIGELMRLSTEHDCHIVCILHLNKSKDNDTPRGHAGSELLNKASDIWSIKKESELFVATHEISRNRQCSPFAFQLDGQGTPVKAEPPTATNDLIACIKRNIVKALDEPLSYSKLVDAYCEISGKSERTAKSHISMAIQQGFIIKNDVGNFVAINN